MLNDVFLRPHQKEDAIVVIYLDTLPRGTKELACLWKMIYCFACGPKFLGSKSDQEDNDFNGNTEHPQQKPIIRLPLNHHIRMSPPYSLIRILLQRKCVVIE